MNEVKVLCPACDGYGYSASAADPTGTDCRVCKGVGHKLRKAEVGDAATISIGSDRYAATVIEVSPSGHQIKLRHDKTVGTKPNMFTEDQSYICVENKNGEVEKATLRKQQDGAYSFSIAGKGWKHVTLGVKRPYRDPSF